MNGAKETKLEQQGGRRVDFWKQEEGAQGEPSSNLAPRFPIPGAVNTVRHHTLIASPAQV